MQKEVVNLYLPILNSRELIPINENVFTVHISMIIWLNLFIAKILRNALSLHLNAKLGGQVIHPYFLKHSIFQITANPLFLLLIIAGQSIGVLQSKQILPDMQPFPFIITAQSPYYESTQKQ